MSFLNYDSNLCKASHCELIKINATLLLIFRIFLEKEKQITGRTFFIEKILNFQ